MTLVSIDTTARKAASTLNKVAAASALTSAIIDSPEYMVHALLLAEVAMKEAAPSLAPDETPMLLAYKNLKNISWLDAGLQLRAKDKKIRSAIAKDLVAAYSDIQESRI